MTDVVRELEEALALLARNGWHAEGTAGRRQVAVKRGWIEGEITLQADAARTLLGLALSRLDLEAAASEAVTEEMVLAGVRAALALSDHWWGSSDAEMLEAWGDNVQAAIEAIAPALLLAGERRGLERAEDAASDAIHDAVYEKQECDRLKSVVTAAIRAESALGRPA